MQMLGYRKVVTRNIDRSNVDWSPMVSYDLGKSKFVVLRILGVRSMESCFEQTWVKQDGLMKLGKNRGFSLLELMITLAIGLVMAGVTVLALMPLFKQNKVDAAYDTTLSVIRTYRSQAITQSKRYIITFTVPGTIEVQYWGVGVPVSPAPVTVATYQLPTDIQFAVQAGFPAAAPDGFRRGNSH